MDEFQLVRRMRIDFNLIPIEGVPTYKRSDMKTQIWRQVKKIITLDKDDDEPDTISPSIDVTLYGGKLNNLDNVILLVDPTSPSEYDQQLKDGDPGFVIIRDVDGFGFVKRYDGRNWVQKFNNARRFIVHELNCTFYYTRNGCKLLLLTRLSPSEDARQFINLSLSSSSSSSSTPPTLVIKPLPFYYLANQLSLLNFFRTTLAKLIRDVYLSEEWISNNIFIEFKNRKACYKAFKKLCSHSLIKNGNAELVDYKLTFKDDPLVSNKASHEVLVYKYNGFDKSATTDAVNNQLTMLEKELSTLKVVIKESDGDEGCNCSETPQATALKHRLAMVEERLNTVKEVMEELGAEWNESRAIQSRVSMLENELNALKVLMEEYNKSPAIKALEHRVAVLEKELNTVKAMMKESSGGYDRLPATKARDRPRSSKRLRRDSTL